MCETSPSSAVASRRAISERVSASVQSSGWASPRTQLLEVPEGLAR